jgi:hypothetical protein
MTYVRFGRNPAPAEHLAAYPREQRSCRNVHKLTSITGDIISILCFLEYVLNKGQRTKALLMFWTRGSLPAIGPLYNGLSI